MPERESVKNTANKRAECAYRCVKNVVDNFKDKKTLDSYKSYSKKLMAMIKVNGLASTAAFMKASFGKKEGGGAYRILYENIEGWLCSPDCPVNAVYNKGQGEMACRVISFDRASYRSITKEVLEFINWVRRFAEGMIKDESSD